MNPLPSAATIAAVAAAVLLQSADDAHAQPYPQRPIRIVTSGVGGGSDFAARLLASGLTEGLRQQVIVDNRPSGFMPAEIVSKAPPDGYTLLLATGILWIMPLLHDKVSFDAVADFAPVTTALSFPNLLLVNLSLPAKTVPDLIALAKAKRGGLNYGTTGSGSAGHLAAELMKSMAGIDLVRIAYKSGGTLVSDLVSGQIQVSFISAGSATPHVRAGRLRALAVTGAEPTPIFPELPTMSRFLPGFEVESVYGVFVPAKTPRSIIVTLQQQIARVVHRPEIKEKLLASGLDPVGSPPEALAELRRSEIVRMGKVIREAGIRAE